MSLGIRKIQLSGNSSGRDFIIGDLHGCYDLLQEKLNQVKFNHKIDRLFCVGDLIDRGPDSAKCAELLYEPWFFSTMGNHELMFLTYMNRLDSEYQVYDKLMFMQNDGHWVHQVANSMLEDYADKIMDLPAIIETPDFIVTHSELTNDAYCLDNFVWNRNLRNRIYNSEVITVFNNIEVNRGYNLDKKIVYVGHNLLPKAQLIDNHLMIDTGAFAKGEKTYDLTIIEHKSFKEGLEKCLSELTF